jgi:hypothetical protein
MSGQDFLKMIEGSQNLELVKESEASYFVINNETEKKYEIKKDSISKADWENINSVLAGREPIILDGITRIVGYFSKVSNWNKSKLGELKDRRDGNYKVGSC